MINLLIIYNNNYKKYSNFRMTTKIKCMEIKYKISIYIYITNSKNNIFLKKIIHNLKNKLVS